MPLPINFKLIRFEKDSNLAKGMPEKKIPVVKSKFPAPLMSLSGGCDYHLYSQLFRQFKYSKAETLHSEFQPCFLELLMINSWDKTATRSLDFSS